MNNFDTHLKPADALFIGAPSSPSSSSSSTPLACSPKERLELFESIWGKSPPNSRSGSRSPTYRPRPVEPAERPNTLRLHGGAPIPLPDSYSSNNIVFEKMAPSIDYHSLRPYRPTPQQIERVCDHDIHYQDRPLSGYNQPVAFVTNGHMHVCEAADILPWLRNLGDDKLRHPFTNEKITLANVFRVVVDD